jgi:hypothetical protein
VAKRLPLPIQTIYAELVDRCAVAAFDADFPPNGSFVRVPVRGRVYWYFQAGARDETGRQPRKYAGPDSPELAARIAQHGKVKSAYNERRQLIAALRRAGLPAPATDAGAILAAMAKAGVFRLRACIVGTVAYQTYGGVLGIRLPEATTQTGDLDIAQFQAISVALAKDETTIPMREILHRADPSFLPLPHARGGGIEAAYLNDAQYRVEVLVPSLGPDDDAPQALPAITHAQPLRFLDFLIHDAIQAAVLHDGGVLVNVPRPERYALHKLIVSQRRREGAAKVDKDLRQAELLLDVLADRRRADLRDAWEELVGRGAKWRRHACDALDHIDVAVRTKLGETLGIRLADTTMERSVARRSTRTSKKEPAARARTRKKP